MKRYEEIKFNEYFKKILNFQNYSIFDVEHSVARYKERVGNDMFPYERVLKKGINWIIKNNKTEIEDRYIFISKKLGFGIQVHWREDRHTKSFNGYSATTLSNDEMKFFTKNDKRVFLENIQKSGYSLKESTDIFEKGYTTFEFENELKEELELCGFSKWVEVNEIFTDCEVIEV